MVYNDNKSEISVFKTDFHKIININKYSEVFPKVNNVKFNPRIQNAKNRCTNILHCLHCLFLCSETSLNRHTFCSERLVMMLLQASLGVPREQYYLYSGEY